MDWRPCASRVPRNARDGASVVLPPLAVSVGKTSPAAIFEERPRGAADPPVRLPGAREHSKKHGAIPLGNRLK